MNGCPFAWGTVLFFTTLACLTSDSFGQGRLGLQFGVVRSDAVVRNTDTRGFLEVHPGEWTQASPKLLWRSGGAARVSWSFELNYMHFAFHVKRASRFDSEDMDYDMHMLYLGAVPGVRLDDQGRFHARGGIRIGATVAGRRSGIYQEYAVGAGTDSIQDQHGWTILNDSRFVVGIGTELPITGDLTLGIDASYEPRFFPIIGGEPRLGHHDLCLFAGLLWRFIKKES